MLPLTEAPLHFRSDADADSLSSDGSFFSATEVLQRGDIPSCPVGWVQEVSTSCTLPLGSLGSGPWTGPGLMHPPPLCSQLFESLQVGDDPMPLSRPAAAYEEALQLVKEGRVLCRTPR